MSFLSFRMPQISRQPTACVALVRARRKRLVAVGGGRGSRRGTPVQVVCAIDGVQGTVSGPPSQSPMTHRGQAEKTPHHTMCPPVTLDAARLPRYMKTATLKKNEKRNTSLLRRTFTQKKTGNE